MTAERTESARLSPNITHALGSLLAPIVPTLAAWLAMQTADQMWLRLLLAFLSGVAILGTPTAAFVFLGPWVGRGMRVVISIVLAVLLCLLCSVLHLKPLHLPKEVAKTSRMDARLETLSGVTIQQPPWNAWHITDQPMAADVTGAGELHVIVPFVWTRVDRAFGRSWWSRAYQVRAYFVASYDGGSDLAVKPLELKDYLIAPERDWSAYLFGWLEEPFMMVADLGPLERELRLRLNLSEPPTPSRKS
jgi:hypothetical protein